MKFTDKNPRDSKLKGFLIVALERTLFRCSLSWNQICVHSYKPNWAQNELSVCFVRLAILCSVVAFG